jgi:hypothetical protein
VLKENVPSNEKVVSIFEPHTDIIVKGKRQVVKPNYWCSSGTIALKIKIH